MPKVKCPVCEKQNDRKSVEEYKISRRYYCAECYKVKLKNIERDKRLKKLQEEITQEYNDLYDYIVELWGRELDGQMFKQIKRYKEQLDYTYNGIRLTLKYYYRILGNEVNPNHGIGIVPYYYRKASNHYNKIWDAQDYNAEVKLDGKKRFVIPKVKPSNKEKKKVDFKNKEKLKFD